MNNAVGGTSDQLWSSPAALDNCKHLKKTVGVADELHVFYALEFARGASFEARDQGLRVV
jgi:hypothetical protein